MIVCCARPSEAAHPIWHPGRRLGRSLIRESIDGDAGLREGVSNMPAVAGAAAWKEHAAGWTEHYDKLDQIAWSAR